MSAQTDRLLVWRSIRCDAPGLNARSNAGVEKVSTSFHAPRELQQSTRLGPPHNKSFSRSKDGTFLMRLPSVMRGACAPTAATPLKLTRAGGCQTIISCRFAPIHRPYLRKSASIRGLLLRSLRTVAAVIVFSLRDAC
jgi:hypothetical protein